MILTKLIPAKIENKIPGPTARKQEVDIIVAAAAKIDLTKLFIATALADRPGFESTRYTEVGVNAFICPSASIIF